MTDAKSAPKPGGGPRLARFRMPFVLFVIAGGLFYVLTVVELNETLTDPAWVAAKTSLILGLGWLATTLIDWIIKRRLRSLDLGAEDNLRARKMATQLDVVRRVWVVLGAVFTLAAALTVIPGVRQIGVSMFASAGIVGIAIGLAARPMLENLIAGLQIAFTQPIRLDDAVVVENEWGWIEEIGLFYVTIKIWDWRRLVVPISYFINHPFQNWTRQSASIIGSVFWWVDYRAPVGVMREELSRICARTPLWDGNVVNLQVVETDGQAIQIRALASSRSSPRAWDLRCFIREEMVAWLQREHPEALPRLRAEAATVAGGKDAHDWQSDPSAVSADALRQAARDSSLRAGVGGGDGGG